MFTLHNGDCLQVTPSIPSGSIDAIITDLPYGTTACKWDTVIDFAAMWKEVKRVLKPNGAFITTASQPFTSALVMSNPKFFKVEWIWNKDKAGNVLSSGFQPMKVHENILVFGKGKVTYNKQMVEAKAENIRPSGKLYKDRNSIVGVKDWRHSQNRDNTKRNPKSIINISSVSAECNNVNRIHRTQKPVSLYEYLIRTYTNEGETVLDIAMGSGTTIEAAERTGRNSIGIEKDEGIFQSAVLRLKPFTPSNNRLHLTGGGHPATQSSFTAEVIPPAKLPAKSPRR